MISLLIICCSSLIGIMSEIDSIWNYDRTYNILSRSLLYIAEHSHPITLFANDRTSQFQIESISELIPMSEEQQIINNEIMKYIVPKSAPGDRRGRDASDVQATVDRVKRSFIPTQTEQDESVNMYNKIDKGTDQKMAATLERKVSLEIYLQNQSIIEDEDNEYHLQY